MLKQTSKDFRARFLLQFTKELIKATETYRNLSIKQEVKKIVHERPEERYKDITGPEDQIKRRHEKNLRKVIRKKIRTDVERVSQLKSEEQPFAEFFKSMKKPSLSHPVKKGIPPMLQIPVPNLPETVQHYRPYPTKRQIDIGKLNVLVKDPLIKIIECNGPGEKIVVMGAMGRKNTPIILNEGEINDIINNFSETARIPVHEGIFRAVTGNLILSAIVSEVIGSKFIIQKMTSRF